MLNCLVLLKKKSSHGEGEGAVGKGAGKIKTCRVQIARKTKAQLGGITYEVKHWLRIERDLNTNREGEKKERGGGGKARQGLSCPRAV